MSNEEKLPAKMEPAHKVSFIIDPRKHPLAKAIKELDAHFSESVAIIAAIAKDPTADVKERKDAAKFLVETKIDLEQNRAKDILARAVAQTRLDQMQAPRMDPKDVEDDEDRPQRAAFVNDVLDISKTKNL